MLVGFCLGSKSFKSNAKMLSMLHRFMDVVILPLHFGKVN